jgi:hypothetical protein
MNKIRVFYAVYVPSGRVRILLDAIRLFARPQAKHAAHITVRGPYADYQDPREWSAKVTGQPIEVGGVGTFFGPGQSTVFLSVDSPAIRSVWHKPDFPEGKPHLTIYDGDKRPFAESLRDVLAAKDPRFTFSATGVEPIVSGNGPRLLRSAYDPSELADVLDRPPDLAEVDSADDATRLSWIEDLADHLATSAGVQSFCDHKGIRADVDSVVNLVKRHFPSVGKIALRVSEDPESGEKKLVVGVAARCALSQASEAYDRFISEWVNSSDWRAREYIRLSYGIE